MAGSDPTGNFNGDSFRAAIRATMIMGLPVEAADQPTFLWNTGNTYSSADPSGSPYNWGSVPVETSSHASVQVPCAVQFKERPISGDPLGSFDASEAVLTLLDADYVQIRGATRVSIGEITYNIDVVGPPQGLFDVNVYSLFCTAISLTNQSL